MTFHGVIKRQGELLESLHSREGLQVLHPEFCHSTAHGKDGKQNFLGQHLPGHTQHHQITLDVAADGPVPPDFTVFYSFPDAPRLEARRCGAGIRSFHSAKAWRMYIRNAISCKPKDDPANGR